MFIRHLRLALTVVMLVCALVPTPGARAAAIIRVTPTGATSGACGSSWANACGLQHALNDVAISGDDIWVKAGTYKPTTGNDRDATFALKSGVALYGGFAGTETARGQRNWTANVTMLSGEIGAAGNNDNSYHVVTADTVNAATVLDGFTVTGGNANDTSASCPGADCGGGLLCQDGSPVVSSVIFAENAGVYGGGMMVFGVGSAPTLTAVRFERNSVTGYGGGMYTIHGSPALTGVVFDGNSADLGGGMSNAHSSPTLIGVTFNANTVTGSSTKGGAMFNDYSSPTLTNVTFSGNAAIGGEGGAMYNDLSSAPVLKNVTFYNNSASMNDGLNGGKGGAIYNYANTPAPQLTNVTFVGNHAVGLDALHPAAGGAMYILQGAAAITNTILWGNTPDQIYDDGSVTTLHTAVAQGGCPAGLVCTAIITADPLLGALGNYGGSVQTIPLLPGSSALDTGRDAGCPATDARGVARPQGAHCDVGAFESSRFTLGIAGGDNQSTLISTAFAQSLRVSVTANNASEPVNGGQVAFTAPASGASASLATSPATITGGAASVNATANGVRGAYLVTATMAGANSVSFGLRNLNPTVFHVKPGASGNCAAWATACELQTALGQATYGDEIWIATGMYKPTAGSDRNATFLLPNGVGTYGGFAGTESARSQRNWAANVVTLSGDIGAAGTTGDNAYHVVTAHGTDSQTVLDGVTVTGGRGTGQVGGGVLIDNNGSLTIANCRITDNAADYGGGLFQGSNSGRVHISNSRIELNTTGNHGGGLYVGGSIAMTDTQVLSNTATWHGGGLHVDSGSANLVGGVFGNNRASSGNGGGVNANNAVSVSGTQFISNTANSHGGGLLQWNAGFTVTVTNARFERNVAANGDGGGLWMRGNSSVLATTVVSNSAKSWGSGLYVQNGNLLVSNSAVVANAGGNYGGGVALNGGTGQLSRSIVSGNSAGSHGGGIEVWAARLTLTNVVIADNHATLGNGIYLYESPLEAWHTTIARNSGGQGSGIYVNHDLSSYNTVAMTNTILVSHTVGITATSHNTVTLNGVLWYGNAINDGGAGSVTALNVVTGDPAFAADGYHLTARSAAIDRGVSAGVATDVDGDPRPTGTGYELGADEYVFKVYLPLVLK